MVRGEINRENENDEITSVERNEGEGDWSGK